MWLSTVNFAQCFRFRDAEQRPRALIGLRVVSPMPVGRINGKNEVRPRRVRSFYTTI